MTINTDHGCYSRLIHFAKKHVTPSTLEKVETSLVHATTCIPFTIAAMGVHNLAAGRKAYEFGPPSLGDLCSGCAIILGGVTVGMLAVMQFNKQIKSSFIQHEMTKAIDNSKQSDKSMLIFKTSIDPLGAFLTHVEVSRYEQFAKTHSIEVLTADANFQLKIKKSKNTKKYDLIIIKGLSDSKIIAIAKNAYLTTASRKNLRWFNEHLKEGGILSLEGSRTGEGENNIARELSRACPEARVFAPSEDIDVLDGITYDAKGIPTFRNGKEMTRLYQNGELLFS